MGQRPVPPRGCSVVNYSLGETLSECPLQLCDGGVLVDPEQRTRLGVLVDHERLVGGGRGGAPSGLALPKTTSGPTLSCFILA